MLGHLLIGSSRFNFKIGIQRVDKVQITTIERLLEITGEPYRGAYWTKIELNQFVLYCVMHYIVPQLYRTRWRYIVSGACAVLSYRRGQYIDLYHSAANLGSVGNRGFVFALSLPVQPHTEWEVRRAIFCLHTEWYGSIVPDAAVSYQAILYCKWCGVMSYRRVHILFSMLLYRTQWCYIASGVRDVLSERPLYCVRCCYITISGVQYYRYDWAGHSGQPLTRLKRISFWNYFRCLKE